jgi:hypothetical protein
VEADPDWTCHTGSRQCTAYDARLIARRPKARHFRKTCSTKPIASFFTLQTRVYKHARMICYVEGETTPASMPRNASFFVPKCLRASVASWPRGFYRTIGLGTPISDGLCSRSIPPPRQRGTFFFSLHVSPAPAVSEPTDPRRRLRKEHVPAGVMEHARRLRWAKPIRTCADRN